MIRGTAEFDKRGNRLAPLQEAKPTAQTKIRSITAFFCSSVQPTGQLAAPELGDVSVAQVVQCGRRAQIVKPAWHEDAQGEQFASGRCASGDRRQLVRGAWSRDCAASTAPCDGAPSGAQLDDSR